MIAPHERMAEVFEYAQATMKSDKAGRRNLYNKLGLPADDSVR